MKIQIIIGIFLGCIVSASAQVGNEKDMIFKNKVKASIEKHCFTGSNASCTAIWEEYDRRGNTIAWNMGRLGTKYRMIYDKKDRKIFTIWIDKTDTTEIDTIPYVYDRNNELIQDGDKTFKNFYNAQKQLIKQLSESINTEENIVRDTKMIDWTRFGKIRSEITTTEIIETTKPTEYGQLKVYCKNYEYDSNNNLQKEFHYYNDEVTNTITYMYDPPNRLIEKREKNISRLESINRRKFRDRPDFSELVTKISYYKNGSVKEKYTYFSDPCMSLDNHYLYKHFYLDNGLLDRADVYEEDDLVYSISYEYEYYKK